MAQNQMTLFMEVPFCDLTNLEYWCLWLFHARKVYPDHINTEWSLLFTSITRQVDEQF